MSGSDDQFFVAPIDDSTHSARGVDDVGDVVSPGRTGISEVPARDTGSFLPGPSGSAAFGAGRSLPDRSIPPPGRKPQGHSRGVQGGAGSSGSSNMGFARSSGNRRVVGTDKSVVSLGYDGARQLVRSYQVSGDLQFNQVEELQADTISREFAQEIIEKLFVTAWGLNSSDATVMKKAEDVLFAFLAVRGASPYADYDLSVMIGGIEVEMSVFSDVLASVEVPRRRFARAVADDIRGYISHPDNVILRGRIQTKLGIFSQYVHLGFDGSTHCTKMNRNEVAFTKALESRNLFDDESVKGSLKNSSLIDGVFESGGRK